MKCFSKLGPLLRPPGRGLRQPSGALTVRVRKAVEGYRSPGRFANPIAFGFLCLCLCLPERLLGAPGDKLWAFKTGARIRSSPALTPDGAVVFGSMDQKVYSLDARTGQQRWESSAGGEVAASPTIGPDGTIYIGSLNNQFLALDGATGKRKWFSQADNFIYSSASLSVEGVLYFTDWSGAVLALDARTGRRLWVQNLDTSFAYASPALGADGTVYCGTGISGPGRVGKLVALDGQTGRIRWQFPTLNSIQSSAAISPEGVIFVSSFDKTVYALDEVTGAVRWSHLTGDSISSSPALGPDGTLYVGANDGRLYALNSRTGEERWTFLTGDTVHSSPAVAADGTVYFGSYDHKLYALDGASGKLRWTFTTGDLVLSSPSIGADGTVYVGSFDGQLYALAGAAGPADSIWPSFKHDARHTGSGETPGPPIFTVPPASLLVAQGSPVLFDSLVSGSRPMSFRWLFNGQAIAGAANASLTLPNPQLTDAGEYTLIASNALGQASASAALRVGFTLLVKPQGGGRVEASPVRDIYLPDTLVELTAIADTGRRFLGWQGSAQGLENALRITMDRHQAVAASFELTPGELAWETSFPSNATPLAIGPDGTLYMGSGTNVFAFDGETGLARWQASTGGEGLRGIALDRRGRLVLNAGLTLLSMDAASGATRWRTMLSSSGDVALGVDNSIYLATSTGRAAYDEDSGHRKWTDGALQQGTWANAAGADDTIYVVDGNGQLRVLDGTSGQGKNLLELSADCCVNVLVPGAGETLLAESGDHIDAVDLKANRKLWTFRIENVFPATPIVGPDGTVFINGSDGKVRALDQTTGQPKWEHVIGGWYGGDSLAYANDGTLYAGSSDGVLFALDSGTGREKWSSILGGWLGTPLSIGPNGLVYALLSGANTSKLVAVRGTAALADKGWPKFRGNARNTGRAGDAVNPVVLSAGRSQAGKFRVSAQTYAGKTYHPEFKSALTDNTWTPLPPLSGNGRVQVFDESAVSGSQRFYRLGFE